MIRLSAFADEISQDPVEQLDVLGRHGIRHIEFRSIHGTNVLDLSDAQHEEFRDLLRSRGFGLSAIGSPIGKIKITDPFEPHLERFEPGPGAGRLLRDAPHPDLQLLHARRRRPGQPPRRGHPADGRARPPRRRPGGDPAPREREGDLRRHRRPRARHPRDGRLARAWRTPSTRPTTSRSASRSTRPGSMLRVAGHPLPRQGLRLEDARRTSPPAQGDGQIPRLIADAVAHGYDGFCVLEPHLVVAELDLRLHRPRTVRRRRPAPSRTICKERKIAYA